MPLCFPEKITSGPAVMGVRGADPECIGVKGAAKAGGTMPKGRVRGMTKAHTSFIIVLQHVVFEMFQQYILFVYSVDPNRE